MDLVIWLFSFIMGAYLQYSVNVTVPVYLATKTVQALFPAFVQDHRALLKQRYDSLLIFMLLIPVSLLLLDHGIEITLELPRWAPWVHEQTYLLYHRLVLPAPVVALVVKFSRVFFLAMRYLGEGDVPPSA